MNFQEVYNLFEYHWFEHKVFDSKSLRIQPFFDANEEEHHNLCSTGLVIRSFSNENLRSMDEYSSSSENSNISPNSVLQMPKLQTIQSGKEFEGIDEVEVEVGGKKNTEKELMELKRKMRRRKHGSKSLSELEIEELKGFMDLGFEFKDEDKDSNLVLIVPGLQRLGIKEDEDDKKEGVGVSRPYLSESWDVLENKNIGRNNDLQLLLMNWRIPASGDEMEIKNHLKFWAHTIASNVR